MSAKADGRPRRGVVAHLLRRAMGLADPYVLVLSNGNKVAGPVRRLYADGQIKATSTSSTLVAITADGRAVHVDDVDDVTLEDGSPLPDSSGNSGVGTGYWK